MISRSNNVSVMELPNHSVIKMATGNVEHLRGESINCLILDGERYFNNYSKEILIAATLRDENRQVVLLNQSDIYRGNE